MKGPAGEHKSSALRRDCTRGFRRIILDDSIASSHSESLSGNVLSNSFLSDDREGDVSMRSEAGFLAITREKDGIRLTGSLEADSDVASQELLADFNSQWREGRSLPMDLQEDSNSVCKSMASEHTGGARGVDTEVDTDSFVVSDDYLTDDNTSLTTSDGELSRGDGTSHFRAARRQPLRAAKVAIFAVFAALQLSLRKQPFQTEFDEKVPDRHSVLDGSSSDDSIGEYDA
ncbi:unnamed protein product [Heligmosomoides polygyrus]|uniref:Uncharacterized protein n=1 Tax=Heligmosomoides polygyrus TaxID=6339 RepID=A0A183GLS5_HELPZ|nr:unnamed protein product [Heligmosomoides polygyrus]